METAKIRENTQKLLDFVSAKFECGELDNDSMIELIKRSGSYLNIQTIPDYAKANGISYQGAKTCRNVQKIFGVRFIVDNE